MASSYYYDKIFATGRIYGISEAFWWRDLEAPPATRLSIVVMTQDGEVLAECSALERNDYWGEWRFEICAPSYELLDIWCSRTYERGGILFVLRGYDITPRVLSSYYGENAVFYEPYYLNDLELWIGEFEYGNAYSIPGPAASFNSQGDLASPLWNIDNRLYYANNYLSSHTSYLSSISSSASTSSSRLSSLVTNTSLLTETNTKLVSIADNTGKLAETNIGLSSVVANTAKLAETNAKLIDIAEGTGHLKASRDYLSAIAAGTNHLEVSKSTLAAIAASTDKIADTDVKLGYVVANTAKLDSRLLDIAEGTIHLKDSKYNLDAIAESTRKITDTNSRLELLEKGIGTGLARISDEFMEANSAGERIKETQDLLVALGYSLPESEHPTDPNAPAKTFRFGAATVDALRRFQAEKQIPCTARFDHTTAETLLAAFKALRDGCRVEGRAIRPDGNPAAGRELRIWAFSDVGSDATLVATVTTDSAGYFEYSDDAKNLDKRQIAVTEGADANSERLAVGLMGPLRHLRFDFTVSLSPTGELPEHIRLLADINAARGTYPIRQITETHTRKDLTVLHQKTGWDARLIALASLAEKHANGSVEQLSPPAVALYGLFRAGLPTDLDLLARIKYSTVRSQLEKAVSANIIPPGTLREDTFREFAIERMGASIAAGTVSSRNDLLAKLTSEGLISSNLIDTFKEACYDAHQTDESVWDVIDKTADYQGLAPVLPKLKLSSRLAYLTGNHASMVASLMKGTASVTAIDSFEKLVDNRMYQPERWRSVLSACGDGSIPDVYTGVDYNERADRYSRDLARKVRLELPSLVLTQEVEDGEVAVPTGVAPTDVARVLRNLRSQHQWEIGRGGLRTKIGKIEESGVFAGVSGDREKLVAATERLQRLYQMTPSDRSLKVLAAKGISSAQDVLAVDEASFVARMIKNETGGTASFIAPMAVNLDSGEGVPPEEWKLVHRRAQQIADVTQMQATRLEQFITIAPAAPWLGSTAEKREELLTELKHAYPSVGGLENLFNSFDYAEVDPTQSVLSPAAYFVDLLHFIDPGPVIGLEWESKKANWELENGPYPGEEPKTPYDILMERRPDLEHLPLSKENSEELLPYIDVVNEILEYKVANGTLENFEGHDTIMLESASALLAEPRYAHAEAYRRLRDVYPLTLPFDRSLETIRAFLERHGVPLADLMSAFQTTEPSDLENVCAERLGLSGSEYDLLTDVSAADWFGLYGFDDPTTPQDAMTELQSAKNVARRLGISYQELAELLETTFVNPPLGSLALLRRLGVGAREAALFNAGELGEDETTEFERRIARYEALYQQTYSGVTLDVASELRTEPTKGLIEKVVVLTGVTDASFDDARLQYAVTSPTGVDSFVLTKMNLFVRLWRKLGGTMAEVDRRLVSYIENKSVLEGSWSPQGTSPLGNALKGALFYMAFESDLARRMGLTSGSQKQQLLAMISGIGTLGRKPLIEQLFVRWGAQKGATRGLPSDNKHIVPVFDLYQGPDYLFASDSDDAAKLEDHLAAIGAGLRLTTEEIRELLAALDEPRLEDAKLHFALLSRLYQYGLLARLLGMSVHEVVALQRLTGITPIGPLHDFSEKPPPPEHLFENPLPRFVELAGRLKESGLSVEEAEYLGLHLGWTDSRESEGLPSSEFTELVSEVDRHRLLYEIGDDDRAWTWDRLKDALCLLVQEETTNAFFAMWRGVVTASSEIIDAVRNEVGEPSSEFWWKFEDGKRTNEEDQSESERRVFATLLYPIVRQRLDTAAVVRMAEARSKVPASLVSALLTDTNIISVGIPATNQMPLFAGYSLAERGFACSLLSDSGDIVRSLLVTRAEAIPILDDEAVVAVRLEGFLEVPAPGKHVFRVTSDEDGMARLRVGSQEVTGGLGSGRELTLEVSSLSPGAVFSLTVEKCQLGSLVAEVGSSSGTWSVETISRPNTRAHVVLAKALRLVDALGLNEREVRHIARNPADFADFSFGGLPTRESRENVWLGLEPLLAYSSLKRKVSSGSDALITVLECARAGDDAGAHRAIQVLACRGADEEAEAAAALPIGLERSTKVARLLRILELTHRLGVRAPLLARWASNVHRPDEDGSLGPELASQVRDAFRARYTPEAWDRIAQPIFDALRKRQRDALVAYLLHKGHLERPEQLFEELLLDPMTEPVVQTSRLQLAISSVQTFVQRCLMGQEPSVPATIINSEEWQWLKRYRLWEASRKIYLYPENWLEPEFRDDKSHAFAALEARLTEADVSDDLAESAIRDYLAALEEVARLEIMACYVEKDLFVPDEIVHVVGRTSIQPHRYYYRKRVSGTWSPWEQIPTNVEGEHVLLTVWRGRPHLFWVKFQQEPIKKDLSGTNKTFEQAARESYTPSVKLSAQVSLIDRQNGNWGEARTTSFVTISSSTTERDTNNYFMRTFRTGDSLELQIVTPRLHYADIYPVTSLIFDDPSWPPRVAGAGYVSTLMSPYIAREARGGRHTTFPDGKVAINYDAILKTNTEELVEGRSEGRVLLERTGEGANLVLPGSSDGLAAKEELQAKAFIQDHDRCFFLEPTWVATTKHTVDYSRATMKPYSPETHRDEPDWGRFEIYSQTPKLVDPAATDFQPSQISRHDDWLVGTSNKYLAFDRNIVVGPEGGLEIQQQGDLVTITGFDGSRVLANMINPERAVVSEVVSPLAHTSVGSANQDNWATGKTGLTFSIVPRSGAIWG